MADQISKLKLKDVKVVFFNPEDNGFGTSITIDCTAPEVKEQIENWVKENNVGKNNPGEANFKEYTYDDGTKVLQYNFRINEYTRYAGLNGLGKDDIGRGAVVDMIVNSFVYNNKFTAGQDKVGASVSAVVVKKAGQTGADEDLAELLGELGDEEDGSGEEKIEEIPF